ncbi:MAG: outer membrane lipoprotein-sorting protein [Thiomicrorhabdus sp.]|nr:outer membrane lipoprotein-sorting protein [Thiomicrorhabdus sp.]
MSLGLMVGGFNVALANEVITPAAVSGAVVTESATVKPIEDAQTIYDRSVNIFSSKNIYFIVDSDIHYADGGTEERAFILAKKSSATDESSILIRFLAPSNIKCTTVLVNKSADQTSRFAYFPALNRTRVIPEKDKQKEVFGIGISYEDLNKPSGLFLPVKIVEKSGKKFYQLTLKDGAKSSVYLVSIGDYLLTEMTVFRDEQLEKRVKIHQVETFFREKMITSWEVFNPKKNRTIQYKIRPESIQLAAPASLFFKNSLSRCRM